MTASAAGSPATDALRRFAARDFAGWAGLAVGTTVADVAAVFEIDDVPQPAILGANRREAGWVTVEAAGYERGIRVWIDASEVILLDGPDPELPEGLMALLEQLGQPEVRLMSYLGTLPIEGSEWVYPARGLTLYVNPDTMLPLRIVAFVPTTLVIYEARLRLDLETRRLPSPRRPGELR